jgi:hypothetical protein
MSAAILHGIPDTCGPFLADLLSEARCLIDLGRTPAEVRNSIPALNRNLPRGQRVPPFSPGGLAACLDALLAEGPGGGA